MKKVRPLSISPRPRPEFSEDMRDAGFTLLEILVVITIIGLLIGLVAPAALRQLSGARVSVAKQSIERLSSVLDLYDLDMGSYPTTEQGLAALVKRPAGAENWNGPYLKGDAVTARSLEPCLHLPEPVRARATRLRPLLQRSKRRAGSGRHDLQPIIGVAARAQRNTSRSWYGVKLRGRPVAGLERSAPSPTPGLAAALSHR